MANKILVVDDESGISNEAKEPQFVKLYIKHICDINNIPAGSKSVLNAMVRRMHYDSCIAVRPKILESIAKECGMTGKTRIQQVRNNISSLVKTKLLEKVDTGTYAINPFYFARGEWRDIAKLRYEGVHGIKFTTIMTDEGQTHNAEFIKDEVLK